MRVRFSTKAQQDLVGIARFIAADSPRRAESFVAELVTVCEALEQHPQRYPVIPGYIDQQYRRRPFQHYSIIYTVSGQDLRIVRVVSAWLDLGNALDD